MKGSLYYATPSVAEVHDLGPHLRRVVLHGGLAGFRSIAPDQQVKLFLARDGGVPDLPDVPADIGEAASWYARYLAIPEAERPWMRTYTVRRHRPRDEQVDIDFVLHDDAGPASRWAAEARPGDVLGMLGPAVSHLRTPAPGVPKLFVGDETALPAIAAWCESLAVGERAQVHVEVDGDADELPLESDAELQVHWHHRDGVAPGRSAVLLDAVRALPRPDGPLFGWLAGEASAVRALRRHLVGEWGLDKRAVAFAGYWRLHLTQDDGPTAEDAAEAAEIMEELAVQGS